MATRRKNAAWRDYQERAAELFRRMGFDAVVEEALEGARGKHKVDVVARTTLSGVAVIWIVECKYWNSAVPKAHVLTLAQIAQDTGADRAVLLSEKGFQAGAIAVSRKSNVLLTSFDELQSAAADSIADLSIRRTLSRVKELEQDLREILFEYGPRTPAPPELEETITLLGACLEVTLAVVAAQTGRFPVHLPSMFSGERRSSYDLAAIADALESTVGEIATGYAALQTAIANVLKPYVEQSEELIRRVRQLMAGGAAFLKPSPDPVAEEAKLQKVLASMRSVGDCAETLRSAPSGPLSSAVRALMRELIDGPYLWFADPHRKREIWSELALRTDAAAARLAEAAAGRSL